MYVARITKIVAVLALVFAGSKFAIAAEESRAEEELTKVDFHLEKIIAEKVSEEGGDELYINVTSYSNFGQPEQTRVPAFPTYWLGKHLSSVKNISLWRHEFKKGEAVQLIVSVVEHDLPPWNVDDLIGSIKVNLRNNNGKIEASWDHKVHKAEADVEKVRGASNEYLMFGSNSKYRVSFKVAS